MSEKPGRTTRSVDAAGAPGSLWRCGVGAVVLSLGGAGCFFDWTRDSPAPNDPASTPVAPDVPADSGGAMGSSPGPQPSTVDAGEDAAEVLRCDAMSGCPQGKHCHFSRGCGGAGTCLSATSCKPGVSSCGCDGRLADDCSIEASGGPIDETGVACLASSCKICDPKAQDCTPPGSSTPTSCLCKTSSGMTTITCR
jgi:hypothetical protein